jgi:hypothetical protein
MLKVRETITVREQVDQHSGVRIKGLIYSPHKNH